MLNLFYIELKIIFQKCNSQCLSTYITIDVSNENECYMLSSYWTLPLLHILRNTNSTKQDFMHDYNCSAALQKFEYTQGSPSTIGQNTNIVINTW